MREALYQAELRKDVEEYLVLADKLHAVVRRFGGWNELIEGPDGERNILGVSFLVGAYAVPKFALPGLDGTPTRGPLHVHHENEFRHPDPGHSTDELRAAVVNRLRDLGVTLP